MRIGMIHFGVTQILWHCVRLTTYMNKWLSICHLKQALETVRHTTPNVHHKTIEIGTVIHNKYFWRMRHRGCLELLCPNQL